MNLFKKSKLLKGEELEKAQYINESLKWMYDMELLENPQVSDNLYGNIYSISKKIKDLEIIIDKNKRTILIWLKLGFFCNKKTLKKDIAFKVIDNIQKLLPKYSVRVITDRVIFDKALAKLEELKSTI